MSQYRYEFEGADGSLRVGRLVAPPGRPRAFALFAHCFTCTKDSAAAVRLSRELTRRGIAVLRFDFTGLGESEGDLASGGFAADVEDLFAAARALSASHAAPSLLVGHSLGGTACLAAAPRLEGVRAVATIGSPADPAHLEAALCGDPAAPEGCEVDLGGRRFRIGPAFFGGLDGARMLAALRRSEAARLVCHAPDDPIVGFEHARRIVEARPERTSLVTLDGVDHLVHRPEDAAWIGGLIAAWAERFLPPREEAAPAMARGEVLVRESGVPYAQEIRAGAHLLVADEPVAVGGRDEGPNPYDLLLAALGACTSMTLRMYANHKGLPLERVEVRLRHAKVHAEDCAECEGLEGRIDRIERELVLTGALTEAQRARMVEIANRCPVHRTLEGSKVVVTRLADEAPAEER